MTKIVDFSKAKQEREPHATGEAFCVMCNHTWVAVVPHTGDPDQRFECPSCHCMAGRFKFEFGPTEGQLYTCNCGNQLFNITDKYRLYCPRCARQTNLTDLP